MTAAVSRPLILAFDTSGPWVAVALLQGERVLATRAEAMAKGQAERLLPLVQELCPDLRALTALACGIGPGNFTGVRIAVAAARGLALALRIPAHGVSLFEAAALDALRPTLVVLDARRGEIYAQRLGDDARAPWLAAAGEVLPAAGCASILADAGASETLRADRTQALAGAALRPVPPPERLVAAMARIAASRPAEGAPRPAPLYLRAADAAPPREPPPRMLA